MGDIPVDPEVRQAVMRRQLLMQATPGCPAGMAIAQLAGKLEQNVPPVRHSASPLARCAPNPAAQFRLRAPQHPGISRQAAEFSRQF